MTEYTRLLRMVCSCGLLSLALLVLSGCVTSLHEAVKNGDIKEVRMLVAVGADVNALDDRGRAALHADCSLKPEIVEILLANGADVEVRDSSGKQPLHYAAQYNRYDPKCIELLLAHGADVNATDRSNETPLHTMMRVVCPPPDKGAARTVKLLLRKGANPNKSNERHNTPLHLACSHQVDPGVISNLLDAGADVRSRNKMRQTPLHFACTNSYFQNSRYCHMKPNGKIVKLLLDHGALVDAVDYKGQTPIYDALTVKNNEEVIKLLIESGADLYKKDERGCSAVDWAKKQKNPAYTKMLQAQIELDAARKGPKMAASNKHADKLVTQKKKVSNNSPVSKVKEALSPHGDRTRSEKLDIIIQRLDKIEERLRKLENKSGVSTGPESKTSTESQPNQPSAKASGKTEKGFWDTGLGKGLKYTGIALFVPVYISAGVGISPIVGIVAACFPGNIDPKLKKISSHEGWTLFQSSLYNPVQLFSDNSDVCGMRLNMVYSKNHSVDGLDIGIVNRTTGDSAGLQVGAVNFVHGDSVGFQCGGFNTTTDAAFLQTGFANNARNFFGLQIAGLRNDAQESYSLQIAPFRNSVQKHFSGLQLSCVNTNNGRNNGIQMGLMNIADTNDLIQFGVFNSTHSKGKGGGIQVGILNHNPKGFLAWFPFINF